MDIRAQQTAALFKPVEGGYVFRAPYQLGLGAVAHYRVDERQKAELADVIAGKHPWGTRVALAFAAIGAVVIAAIAVFAVSPHKSPTAIDMLAMIALSLVAVAPIFALWRWWKLRQLAPLLARLPRTDEQITRREMRAAAAAAMSVKQLWALTIVFALAGALNLFAAAEAFSSARGSGVGSALSGIMFVGLCIYHGLLLAGRLRGQRVSS
jgi:hypothetical protein